jgi:uncharacterized protein YlbG (UPF0298 family)
MTKTLRLTVAEDGKLGIKDFKPRTFAQALEGVLPRTWRHNPAGLSQAVKNNADLLTVTIGLMGTFEDFLWNRYLETEESIRAATEEIELKSVDPQKEIKADSNLKLLYVRLDRISKRLDRLEKYKPSKWVKSLKKKEYQALVEGFEQFLSQEVTEDWTLYSSAVDNPVLATVHAVRSLPLSALEELQIDFVEMAGASLPLEAYTRCTVEQANAVAKKEGLAIHFEPLVASAAKAPGKKDQPAKSTKPAAKKTAARAKKSASATAS